MSMRVVFANGRALRWLEIHSNDFQDEEFVVDSFEQCLEAMEAMRAEYLRAGLEPPRMSVVSFESVQVKRYSSNAIPAILPPGMSVSIPTGRLL